MFSTLTLRSPIIGHRRNGSPIYAIAGGSPMLDRLKVERAQQIEYVDHMVAEAERAQRDLSPTEQETLRRNQDRVAEIDAQIAPLEAFETRRAAQSAALSSLTSTRPADGQGETPGSGQGEQRGLGAQTRPREHKFRTAGEVIVDRVRAAGFDGSGNQTGPDQRAIDRLESAGLSLPQGLSRDVQVAVANGEQRVHQVTTDTPGLLPETIRGEIVSEVDAARPFMETQGVQDLGSIPGKKWSRPKVTQHTQVGKQAAEKDELASRKLTISDVDFEKETYGGWLNVSRQEIDWTSPAAWDAILRDMQEQYAIETEAAAVAKFVASLDATGTEVAGDDLKAWATAMYTAASEVYGNVKVLPDVIYASLSMWVKLGPITDTARMVFGGANSAGDSSLARFAGNLFELPRVIVPALPAGTLAVGRRSKFECYEQRLGLLSVVEPSVLGVQIAYGGYVSNGFISTGGFAKVIDDAA